VYVKNSSSSNSSNGLIVSSNNRGREQDLNGDHALLKFYFQNVELNFGFNSSLNNTELFLKLGYFKNVYARNLDRHSEDKGSVTHRATGGEQYVDLDTRLFWEPEHHVVRGTGSNGSLVARSEIVNVDGANKTKPVLRVHFSRALRAGESVAFTWEAAVRPFPSSFSAESFASTSGIPL
jgi:hypothetical protein